MPRKAPRVTIVELKGKAEIATIYPLVKQVNPQRTKRDFDQDLAAMLPLGYRCIGAYAQGKLIGACGIWTARRFWCGKFMEADNVVVHKDYRNHGIGKRMMDWLEEEARREKCSIVIADSYTYNHASHRFYFRENYIIKGYSFVKEL